MTIEQIKKIEVFREYLKKGSIVNGNEIVSLYNEVFGPDPHTGRLQHYTSCGSCLRRLVKQLIQAAVNEEVTENPPQSEENNQVDNDTDDKEKSSEIKPQTPKKPSKKKKPVKKKR